MLTDLSDCKGEKCWSQLVNRNQRSHKSGFVFWLMGYCSIWQQGLAISVLLYAINFPSIYR